MSIKVSVIIPAYNVEKYIERTIQSVLNQSLKEIEIIVVNDGSTDQTREIIEKIALKDSRLRIINKKNGGLSSARNTGLEIVKGKYIQNLDGDDWIEPGALEVLYKISEENNLDILISDFYWDDDNGNLKLIKSKNTLELMNNQEYLREFLIGKEPPYIWAKFIKSELYKDIRHPLEISLGEDMVVSAKLGYIAKRIMRQSSPFVHYINNIDSITKSNSRCEKEIEKFMAVEMVANYLLANENTDKMRSLTDKYRLLSINYFLYQSVNFKSKKYNEAYKYFVDNLKNLNPNILKGLINMKQIKLLKLVKKFPQKLVFKILNVIIKKIQKYRRIKLMNKSFI